MRTIQIPISKLIKYIPSEPDGGVIPGKVLLCDYPVLVRDNAYQFSLHYQPVSRTSFSLASCILDEELDVKPDSNHFLDKTIRQFPTLLDDGNIFEFRSGIKEARWFTGTYVSRCIIPDPFDALGQHQLSSFVRAGLSHIACCALDYNDTCCPPARNDIRIAVINKDANLISPSVIESKERLTFGPPCQHNVGWLISWASKSKGINIAWLEDKEMDQFVSEAQPLPK